MGCPTVAIVGAGPGGLTLARQLHSSNLNVVIIDGKGYHELNSGTLGVFIDPSRSRQVLIPYSAIPGIGTVLQACVTQVQPDIQTLQLQNGASVRYDWLVLCPGSTYADGPIKNFKGSCEDRRAVIHDEHERLMAAKEVLVIGGGIVGVELAGEIVTNLPDKEVTIVCAGGRLIPDKPPTIGQRALEYLEKRGAKVLLNTRAKRTEDCAWVTCSGQLLAGDVVYQTVGGTANTGFLKGSGIPTDSRGFIKVDEHLRVEGFSNVFAVGDATNVKETKLGYLAAAQARVTARNLTALLEHGNKAELATYQPFGGFEFMTGQAMLFTLGRSDGVSQGWFAMWLRCANLVPAFAAQNLPLLWDLMMGADGWFAGWLKAKEQYTGKTRRDLGLDESRIIGSMAHVASVPSMEVRGLEAGLAALQLKIADKPYAPQALEVSVST